MATGALRRLQEAPGGSHGPNSSRTERVEQNAGATPPRSDKQDKESDGREEKEKEAAGKRARARGEGETIEIRAL